MYSIVVLIPLHERHFGRGHVLDVLARWTHSVFASARRNQLHAQAAAMRPVAAIIVATSINLAKTDEAIEMPSGEQTHVGQRNHLLHGVHIGVTWRIQLNLLSDAGLCLISLITCYY